MNDRARPSIVLTSNTSWYLWNFRRRLAEELDGRGFQVVFVAPEDDYSCRLREQGRFCAISMNRKGKNPVRELITMRQIARLLDEEKPDIVLSWTPKLNLYCSLLSRSRSLQVIPNVAGLGAVFVNQGMLAGLVGVLYRFAFARLGTVFFQNKDDLRFFEDRGWLNGGVARLLPGSGVDLGRFEATELPENDPFVFLFAGRLIADKGLPQLVEAGRKLRQGGDNFVIRVHGHLDPDNPTGIPEAQLHEWHDRGDIDYQGATDRIEAAINLADAVVLPSFYREGIPRILLEAAACGRPVITTDSVGCREAVEDGENGYLCDPRSVDSLAAAMKKLLQLSPAERQAMGNAARQLAETRFDERIVINAYMTAVQADSAG